ncbi:MAG: hypothetical protein ACYSWO_06390 [Planctomycetota bacterium]|jgi:arylsulfatase A-like enzyme
MVEKSKLLSVIGIAMIILVTAFSCSISKKENSQNQLPNIVLLMGDDHGWDEVGYNGPPGCADRTAMTLRGQKGDLYEGGVRVPGVLEWPAGINVPASTSVIAVASDILPTLSELTGQPLPDRSLDGISLVPFFNDPEETINLADEHPEIVEQMQLQIRNWQESVLNSLTGADYNQDTLVL